MAKLPWVGCPTTRGTSWECPGAEQSMGRLAARVLCPVKSIRSICESVFMPVFVDQHLEFPLEAERTSAHLSNPPYVPPWALTAQRTGPPCHPSLIRCFHLLMLVSDDSIESFRLRSDSRATSPLPLHTSPYLPFLTSRLRPRPLPPETSTSALHVFSRLTAPPTALSNPWLGEKKYHHQTRR
ncbi:hypothetical protein CGCF415_v005624 [Colletotrichum fructicola]|nr:hypothetical protein CGCFRS4_v007666 [Colletotrichum fructicola]KAF4909922.1 hypothetical protein CGCF415_v005624 [Colletotrichum fructicola]KAF4933889.1 hypothetical protein CGCF245_v009160 [Colletotrichum fructicola]